MATRDPEATRQRILDAALREFSDKGISGARVDAIAERAGVNKRMLYYYFGSKEDLFRKVLQLRMDEISSTPYLPDAAAPGRLAGGQRYLTLRQDYVRLLAWEALEECDTPIIEDSVRRAHYESWVAAVEAEQRAGTLPADLDAAQLVLSELCLVMGPFLLPQLTRLITGHSPTTPRHLERRAEFLNALERRLAAPE